MRTFKDSAGRTWSVSLTVDAIRRVRSLLNVDLCNLLDGDPPLLARLELDPVLLCDVLFAFVKPEADAQSVTDVEFGRAMGGDCLTLAQDALFQELADFFRQRRRMDLAKAIQKQSQLVAAAVRTAESKVEAISEEAAVASIFGNSSGNSPASSESTPAR